jgi:mono/diheme cytochrome c family protein
MHRKAPSAGLALALSAALGFGLVSSIESPVAAAPPPLLVAVQDGSPERGRQLFVVQCAICHRYEGIPQATGALGPDLTGWEAHPNIVNTVPNTPENLARWLANPMAVRGDATMPPLGLSTGQISDLVAFLLPAPVLEDSSGQQE